MKKQYLILEIHNHQPVDNFDFVFERCYQKAYFPFLEVLKAHPGIKVNLHYSGILWDWFLKTSSPILDLLIEMLERGQIEFLSGGYYEPILAILPDTDKIGQIRKFNSFLSERFHVQPRGMWLAERVWEPHLVKYISEAGIEYLAVDDLHFRAAGLSEAELGGYYLTEEQGKTIKVFPGSKYLRYSIPFKNPQETIDYLAGKNKEAGNLTVMADDGEKFGVWPGTYNLAYEEGWLDKFFTLIENNHETIETITCSEYIDRFPALGRIYLPTASYSEMEEWALPLEAGKDFLALKEMVTSCCGDLAGKIILKGGYWRNFLSKYSESNHIYRKMLWISDHIQRAKQSQLQNDPTASEGWLEEAKLELWKGQCNDSYWHGLFGGLYLPHLRHGVYTHLIRAESILDQHLHPAPEWIECLQADLDGDGEEELLVKTPLLSYSLDLDSGGVISELDYRPKSFNLINSLMRRPENYHQKLYEHEESESEYQDTLEVKSIHDLVVCKDNDLMEILHYDRYPRYCLMDHFFSSQIDLTAFSRSHYQEYGDFISGKYQKQIKSTQKSVEISLYREGLLQIEGSNFPLRLEKTITLNLGRPELLFSYRLINIGSSTIRCKFGVEFNLNLLAGRSDDRYYQIPGICLNNRELASQGLVKEVEQLQLIDEYMAMIISFDFSNYPTVWRFPIETASNSESGFEKVYQGSVILPTWDLTLSSKAVWSGDFRLGVAEWQPKTSFTEL